MKIGHNVGKRMHLLEGLAVTSNQDIARKHPCYRGHDTARGPSLTFHEFQTECIGEG